MLKWFTLLFCLSLCLAILADVAEACTCELPERMSPRKAIKLEKTRADSVFAGAVISIVEKSDYTKIVRIRVDSVWKGSSKNELTVITGKGGGDCGFPFEVGSVYLIYADLDSTNNLSTNSCSRTKLLSDAEQETRILGKPIRTKRMDESGPLSTLYGSRWVALPLSIRAAT